MTRSPDPATVFEALADPDCRAVLDSLDEPLAAKQVAARCDLSRTGAYRKLAALSDAGLVDERTDIRLDGHHTTTYVRDLEGLLVDYDDGSFDVEVVAAGEGRSTDGSERADERLERFWTAIASEL